MAHAMSEVREIPAVREIPGCHGTPEARDPRVRRHETGPERSIHSGMIAAPRHSAANTEAWRSSGRRCAETGNPGRMGRQKQTQT